MKEILGLYLRLSDEDDLKGFGSDSGSIENQRKLLTDYINARPDLAQYEVMEFIDDGYTGTNFERPAMQRMLELVKVKRIKCIAVKDFSRFGRNYILVGKYLEEIFPFLGVRFISVNDRFDSKYDDAVGALDIGFKNIMHDYYSKMTSAKITQALRFQAEHGTLKLSAFYGYERNKQGKIVINPDTAKIVRQIFDWRIEGLNATEIAKRLNDADVPAPHPNENIYSHCWSANNVYHIIHNEKYTGKYVFGKRKCVNYKSRMADESNWVVIENAFEPVITEEEFRLANPTISKKKSEKTKSVFCKKIICGHCGVVMTREGRKTMKYLCRTRKVTNETRCPDIKVNESKIENIVLKLLNKYIELYSQNGTNNTVSSGKKTNINKLRDDIRRINAEIMALYEEYVNGNISKTEHMNRREEIGKKKELLDMQLKEYEAEENTMQEKQKLANKLKVDSSNDTLQELTPDIVDEFVDKIIVYDEDHIEILWNFKDMFSEIEDI